MAKYAVDACIDGGLDYIAANAKRVFVCSTQPASYADASETTAYNIASATVTSTHFTKANGDSSGRKITVAQQSSKSVAKTATAKHVTIATTSALICGTNCTSQALTTGNTVTVPAWDIEIADPT